MVTALLLACDSTPDEYTPEPNVFCLLRTDRMVTQVLCGMTANYYDSFADLEKWNGVAGAVVHIRHNGAEFACRAIPDSIGFYATDSVTVLPRDTYAISIRYPTGENITGSTVVPDTFSFTRLDVDTNRYEMWPGVFYYEIGIDAQWGRSVGAADYLLQADAWYVGREDSLLWRYGPYIPSAGDPGLRLPLVQSGVGGMEDTLFLGRARLLVWAADRNYVDYVTLSWGLSAYDRERFHLDGAVGVFGSASIAETTLYFSQPR